MRLRMGLAGMALLLITAIGSSASAQQMAIPSYFAPGRGWTQMESGYPTVGLTIINPSNGVGGAPDSAFAHQAAHSQSVGLRVIGYVYTRYGGRNPAKIKGEIDRYYSWYHVDGIFFDEVSTDCLWVPYYTDLHHYVKAKGGPAITVGNPGAMTNECYMGTADIHVIFEGPYQQYTGWWPDSWVYNYDADRFWHLVYATANDRLATAVQKSKQRHAGWVYATPDRLPNPWDTLPTGTAWQSELAAVQEPASLASSIGARLWATVMAAYNALRTLLHLWWHVFW